MTKILPKLLLLFFITISGFVTFNASANTHMLIEEKNFQALAKKMKQEKKGLLLMMHAEGCTYCERLEEELLYPMEISGDYKKNIFIRKLQVDSGQSIIDFSGKKVDPEVLSDRYDGRLTPTILFLDSKGQEATEKLIGYNTPSLYGGYVENQLNLMRKHIMKTPN